MASIIKVDDVQDAAGNNIIKEAGDTITIGASGDTISIPSGATIANSGTATGFGLTGVTTAGGNVTITDGNLIPGTAGKGIDFSINSGAGGMTAQLLDDYEEGTFTASTTGISYTYNTGYYKKIGNLVYIMVYVIVNTYTSGSRVYIGGLPFTSQSNHADSRYPVSASRWQSLHVSTISLNPFIINNGTTIGMDGEAASADTIDANIEVWGTSAQMTIAGCYMSQ